MYFRLLLFINCILLSGSLWAADAARVVFAAGDVSVAGQPTAVGHLVTEGQLLKTGKDGYLYIETLDKGFFILRPNSAGQIITYQIDRQDPTRSRIKLELQNGVARHISGDAVKKARHNFRFNTPVAAVGVRGTDFTIYASEEITRIVVLSGGVVVSPVIGTCAAGGFGPCEGPSSHELFASKRTQVLQVSRGQTPFLMRGDSQAPDAIAPPRADEPGLPKQSTENKTSTLLPGTITDLNLEPLNANAINQLTSQSTDTAKPAGPSPLIWGRWQPVLGQAAEVDVAALQASNNLVATNPYYALMRSKDDTWKRPLQPGIGFTLQQSQAVILNESTRAKTAATLENGQLQVNFIQSSFYTKFDLVHQDERFVLQNSGQVSSDGKLYGGAQFLRPNNMDVRGALSSDNRTAAYLFQSRLDVSRVVSGATFWGN